MLKSIKIKSDSPFFEILRWEMATDCYGEKVTDLVSKDTENYYLYDGKRRYYVAKEIFNLWLKAYEYGKT